MKIRFIDNKSEAFGKELTKLISESDELHIAVSYLRASGLDYIKDSLISKKVQLIVGLGFAITDDGALKHILEDLKLKEAVKIKIYYKDDEMSNPAYHPKVYIGTEGRKATVLLGSSNISEPAFTTNIEANILLKGDADEPEIKKIRGFFDGLWKYDPNCRDLDSEMVEIYSKMHIVKKELDAETKRQWATDNQRIFGERKVSSLVDDSARYWVVTYDNFTKEEAQKIGRYGVDHFRERFHGGTFTGEMEGGRGVEKGDIFIIHYLGNKSRLVGRDVAVAVVTSDRDLDGSYVPEWDNPARKESKYYSKYPHRVSISLADEDVLRTPVKSQIWLDEITDQGISNRAINASKAGSFYRGRTIIPLTDEEAKIILKNLSKHGENDSILKYIKTNPEQSLS